MNPSTGGGSTHPKTQHSGASALVATDYSMSRCLRRHPRTQRRGSRGAARGRPIWSGPWIVLVVAHRSFKRPQRPTTGPRPDRTGCPLHRDRGCGAHADRLAASLRARLALIRGVDPSVDPHSETGQIQSTLSADTPIERMVLEAKMRWRIERGYQDLKQDLGMGDYEGQGRRGFHHHASLAIAAYGFLMEQQLRHPQRAGKKLWPTPGTCPIHALQASRQPSARSASSHHSSRACGGVSPQPCSGHCHGVRAACA